MNERTVVPRALLVTPPVDPIDAFILAALSGKASLAQSLAVLAYAEAHARRSATAYSEASS